MKTPLLQLVCGACLALILTGCEVMTFARYSGEPRTWPTGSSFSEAVYDVPVYRGWPEKPYDVLGLVQFDNPNVDWNRGDIMQAAKKAREVGGDAIILVPRGTDPSPTMLDMRRQLGITGSHTVAVVIRWK